MVEFEIKVHPKQRLAYIPKEIVKALGLKLKAVANCQAVILFPEQATPQEILKSIQTLEMDFEQRIEINKKAIEANE